MGTTRGQPTGQGVGEKSTPLLELDTGNCLGEAGLHRVAIGSLILDPIVHLLLCALLCCVICLGPRDTEKETHFVQEFRVYQKDRWANSDICLRTIFAKFNISTKFNWASQVA